MKEQIKSLLVLQNHDIRVQELEKEKITLPEEVKSMRRDVEDLRDILQKEIDQLEEVTTWKKEKERELQTTEDNLQKRMKDIEKISTGRDYFDLQKELEYHKKKVKDHEFEIIKLMDAVEEREKTVSQRKEQLAKFFEKVEQREKDVADRLKSIEEEYTKLVSEREEMFTGVDKTLIRKYDFLAKRRFPPLVEAVDEKCMGCHMGIPPQKFNSLYEVDEIIECPFCSRILYIKETLE